MNILRPVSTSGRWTKSAIECISHQCVCGTCPMMDKVYHCQMKRTVLDLVKRFGDLDETFDFIRKQNFNSYHTFHITDEKTIEQFERGDEEREKNDATGLC